MKNHNRLLFALLAPIMLAWSFAAEAQNCNNGNALFHKQLAGIDVSCSQASCHGPDPKNDLNHIVTGGAYAGSGTQAGNIDVALDSVPDMSGLRTALGLTPSDLDDLALYIWYRAGNQSCPAAAPALTASPTSLSFGSITVGSTSASQSVTITNTGGANAPGLTRSNSNAAEFLASGTCTTVGSLAAGASCTLTVSYKPSAAGADTATYTLTSGAASATVNMDGAGVAAAPNVSASPSSLAFGNVTVGQTSSSQTITVSNTGAGAANNMVYPAAPAKFNKSGTCSGATLNAGASCTVVFTYSPTATVTDNATYTITGGGSTMPISLSGTGTAAAAPNVSASPSSLAFGNVTVGQTSSSQTITVSNTGTAAANDMAYPAAPAKFNKSGTCGGATLNAGASCTVVFTYSPTATVTDNATYTITGGGSTMPISLSGTGTAAAAPNVSASPSSLAFGNVTVGQTSSSQTITVSNTGTAAANDMAYPAAPAKFNKSGTCGGATLNAGASCTVVFTYSPTATVTDNATYTITGGGSTMPISLSGTGTAAPTPNLSASPPLLSFGSVTAGTSSAPQTVTVTNTGGATASSISMSNGNAAEFVVSANTCGSSLAAGASCTLNVTYSPSAAGADNANLTWNYTGGSPAQVAMSGTGTAAASPNLSASPASLSFGSVTAGSSSAPQTVTISNTGGATASGISMSNGNAAEFVVSANTCGASLAAGASCSLNVTYSPSAAGADNANLTWNYTGGSPVVVAMSGTGTAPGTPNLSAAPASLSFGNVTAGASSAPQTVTISNTGGATASGISMSNGNAAEFVVSANTCGASLAAGASCSLSVTYSPSAAGADNANLTWNYTGGSPVVVAMSGTGTAPGTPNLSAAPASLSFGNVTAGASSAPQTVTISNTGGATASGISMSNGNAAEFVVSANTCGASLAAGASCSLSVTYSPSAAGADNANLTWNYTGGSPVVVAMSGTGTAPGTPNLSASPASLAFGNITVGTTSSTQTVTLSNTGGAQATGIAFANSNATKFPISANTCAATLATGASCTFSVAYAPSGSGADSASLTISATGVGNVVVSLSGTGTSAPSPSLSATPPLASFGNVTVGQTSTATAFTISNTGSAAATGMVFANSNAAEFAASGNTCGTSLNAGATCALSVAYTPGAAGADSATLTLTYSGGGSLTISLSGTGVAPPPPPGTGQLSMPASVVMPDQTLGAKSAPQVVTVSNVGSATVTVTSITSSNPAEFAVSGSTCASVSAAAACAFNVTFSPSATGARTAMITVTSNGIGSPQAILATGNGLGGGPPPPPTANVTPAIEYHHALFDHYFITAVADEITKLDNGTFAGWTRTGKQFNVNSAGGTGRNAVCRFFSTAFGIKSSHFYTPDAPECTTVKTNANWQFEGEGSEVFFTIAPALDGTCPSGTSPVYRVYNNGHGGAPNHRYTTDLTVRATMLAQGWIPEGYGPIGVIMCSPN